MNKTDTQLINWLEKQGSSHLYWKVQTEDDYPHVKGCVFVSRNSTSGYTTLREAVSLAISAGKKKK